MVGLHQPAMIFHPAARGVSFGPATATGSPGGGDRQLRVAFARRIPVRWREKSWSQSSGYGSIPINTILSGMNIHLPAILGFTRYQGFDPSPSIKVAYDWDIPSIIYHHLQIFDDQFRLFEDPYGGSHPSKSGLIPFISSINGMLIYKLMDYLFEPIHHL